MEIFYRLILTFFVLWPWALVYSERTPQNFPITDSLHLIEKVYLHIDRDSYFPGDDIWFKGYLIDASSRLLSDHSANLHVELISPAMKIIDNRIVRLIIGLGNGDFHLPDTLQSGRYRLRSYTNYMRNFGDQLFYDKEITIINPADAERVFFESTDNVRNNMEITFFPEGGSLVDNVPSIVAFKAVDASGKGCDVSGEIYSSTGEIVTTFKSTHKGMGVFSLSPVAGTDYYAIVKDGYGNNIKREIPKSFSTGIVLNVSKNHDGELSLIFKTNALTLSLILDHDLSLSISSHNITTERYTFRMNSLNSHLKLPANAFPDGISMLTLSGVENIPLCERLVYKQNDEDARVNIESDRKVYNQRDSVALKISLSVKSQKPHDAFLSLSATKNISDNSSSQFPSSISSWFLLESDVHGPVEEPSYYFDSGNPDRLKDLDLLLLTSGWRDFQWKYKDIYFQAENGFNISGRLRKKLSDVAIKNSRVNIGIFKNGNPQIAVVPTDSSGRFSFTGVDLTGNAKLVVSATGENERLQGWVLLDSLNYSPAEVQGSLPQSRLLKDDKPKKVTLPNDNTRFIKEKFAPYIQYASINNSIRRKYKLSDTINPGEVTITAKRQDNPESGISKAHHNLKTLFPDKSLIITPQLERYGNVRQLMAVKLNLWHSPGGSGVPIFLLDGMVREYKDLAAIPVSMIERVDFIDGLRAFGIFGERACSGAISITTRNDWGSSPSHVYHSANISFRGYDEPRIFYSPKHHTKLESDYKPDLRTTLFWEPDIKVENNKDIFLNYYNGDNPSKVNIVVEGITTSGIPVTGKAEYEVK